MKILIAEDDFTSRTILQAILTKWGYDVTCTCNGDEAFNEFQKNDASQLGILDWEMPGMKGIDLCRMLRKQKRENPLYLILLTSKDDSDDMVRGLDSGADDYISKPYNNAELHARIHVGHRLITMQNKMREREKLQGVLEMAGAICHELNQPLQSALGFLELFMMDVDQDNQNHEYLSCIKTDINHIAKLTRKIMNITQYKSKPYLNRNIVDIDQSSSDE